MFSGWLLGSPCEKLRFCLDLTCLSLVTKNADIPGEQTHSRTLFFSWAVPVWLRVVPVRLECPSLAAGHPTLARAVPFHWVIPVPLELLNVKGHSLLRCLTLTI